MSRTRAALGGLLLLFVFGNSLAATLGEINVLSAVGEPFSATIEVQLSSTDDADRLVARIAPPDTHTAFGINYEAYLSTINVEVVPGKEKLVLVLKAKSFSVKPTWSSSLNFDLSQAASTVMYRSAGVHCAANGWLAE